MESIQKALPSNLTSYDLLKFFAIVTMVIDHAGLYFFPDDMWWRAIGRLSAPVWLFLIGYARSRDLSLKLWGGAAILSLSSFLVVPTFFPLNILWGIILVRLVLDKAAGYAISEKQRMIALIVVIVVSFLPTMFLFDYGSFCLMMALLGYIMRHRNDNPALNKDYVFGFTLSVLIIYFLGTLLLFEFDTAQTYFVGGGFIALAYIFYIFRPQEFPMLTFQMPIAARVFIKIGGRHSLEVYVGHLLLFRLLGYWYGYEGLGLFEWSWF